MRFPKKSLIRDSAVDFCVSKIATTANQVFAAQKKRFDYPPRPKQKQTIKKMELIKTIRARVGTLRLAELRPLMRFPQFVACSRLHGRKKFLFPPFRRTMFFCCAKKTVRLSALAPNINRHPFGCLFMFGGRGWIRTTEAEKQQIYSLPPLATRELAHIKLELVMGLEPATC